MTIRLIEKNIVDLWETIKFACDKADSIGPNRQAYFNTLLNDLLSNKAQCFMRIDKERSIETVIITRIMTDRLYDEKFLHIQCVYSWSVKSPEAWKSDFNLVKEFAIREKCAYISTVATRERAQELASSLGLVDSTRTFIMRI